MEQKFRLLVVGLHDYITEVLECGFMFPNLRLIPRPYLSSEETALIMQKDLGKFDGVLFTGPISYMRASKVFENRFPMTYVSYGGKALFKALFQAVNRGVDLSRISIDTVNKQEVSETLNELELCPQELFCFQYGRPVSTEEVVQYHMLLYKKRKVDIAFTCLQSAYKILLEQGVPTIKITPPRSAVIDALKQAQLNIGENMISQVTQLVALIIEVHPVNELSFTSFEIHEKLLEFERMILRFTNEVEGHLIEVVGKELASNRGKPRNVYRLGPGYCSKTG
ncbi:MAG: hypothetical protein ACYCVD_09040 [Desulfitobacteriaceae bacterium]